jgi:hypothetical protein
LCLEAYLLAHVVLEREREDGGRDKRGDRGGVEGVLGEDLLLHVICLRKREGGRDSEIRERAGEGGERVLERERESK